MAQRDGAAPAVDALVVVGQPQFGVVVLFVQIGALSAETQYPRGFQAASIPSGWSADGLCGSPRGTLTAHLPLPNAMPAFALRFVGREALPPRLSEFDREQFFTLTSADVTALREQFRSDHRLSAALMLMFMRVAGRPLDGFNVLPRNLLRHTAQVLAVSPTSIASLRSIYKRRQTLSKHQLWAKTHLGLRELEIDDEAAMTAALLAQAADASHADDLVKSASHWLFTRRIRWPCL